MYHFSAINLPLLIFCYISADIFAEICNRHFDFGYVGMCVCICYIFIVCLYIYMHDFIHTHIHMYTHTYILQYISNITIRNIVRVHLIKNTNGITYTLIASYIMSSFFLIHTYVIIKILYKLNRRVATFFLFS